MKLVRKMWYSLLTVFDKVRMNHHKMRGMTFQQSQYTPILFVSMTNVVLNKIQDTTFATQVTRIICTQQFHCIMLECVQGLKSSVSTVCKKTCLGYLFYEIVRFVRSQYFTQSIRSMVLNTILNENYNVVLY